MRKPTPIPLSIGLLRLSVPFLLMLSMACAVPGLPAPTQDINVLGTLVMQTMAAGATQTSLAAVTVDVLETATAAPTIIPEFPTLTLSPTIVLTATPAFTVTPLVPLVSVSVPTNCRLGPGRVYDRVGGLQAGQFAEVVGRNAASDYWYIRNPSREGFCWLWGEYATLTGNLAALPVFTPPPTPTPMPAFDAEFERVEACANWRVDIRLVNTGGITFESISLTVIDTDTDIVTSAIADYFADVNNCSETVSRDRLNPGADRMVTSSPFTYNPRGHRLRATITLCSRDRLNGTCITEVIEFRP